MKPLIILLSLLIAGCTTPAKQGNEKTIPDKRIFNSAYLTHKDGNEWVHFRRDKGIWGSACTFILFIDGNKAFALRQSNSVSVSLPPGDHFFRIESGCAGTVESVSTTLELGKPQEFRVFTGVSESGISRTK